METVRSAAISGQYPMWIDDLNIIGYDYERLNVHLSQVLNYGQETILQLRGELFKLLWSVEDIEDFWEVAAEGFSTEVISIILQSLESTHLQYLLSYQNSDGDTALHRLANYRRADAINTVLDCVNEEWCYHLLQIASEYSGTPIHWSCEAGDGASLKVMLDHVNQDMRYSLLQMRNHGSNNPLHLAVRGDPSIITDVILPLVTKSLWIDILQMRGIGDMTVLQYICYVGWLRYSFPLQTILNALKDAVGDETWLQLLSDPLPDLDNHLLRTNPHMVQSFDVIQELRAEAMVKCVLKMGDIAGITKIKIHAG